MLSLAVIVAVNGTLVPSAPPARLLFGHVVAPLSVVARLTARITTTGDTVLVVAHGRTCALTVGTTRLQCDDGVPRALALTPFRRDGATYVPLADVARALGATVTYDGTTETLGVHVQRPAELATPAPFDPLAPQASPTAIFTPEPPKPTPRPTEAGRPRPRRTAIPAIPSRTPPP